MLPDLKRTSMPPRPVGAYAFLLGLASILFVKHDFEPGGRVIHAALFLHWSQNHGGRLCLRIKDEDLMSNIQAYCYLL